MNNEWKSISDAGFQVKKMYFNEATRPAARKTVRDLLFNIDGVLSISHHTSQFIRKCFSGTRFFFIQNKFHRSLIFHYFIRFNMSEKVKWWTECLLCFSNNVSCYTCINARARKKRQICECFGADKERKLNSSEMFGIFSR